MGLDTEYSAQRVCPVEGCDRNVEYIVNVQWTFFDFLVDGSCREHLAYTERYWLARTVDGWGPVISVEAVWP